MSFTPEQITEILQIYFDNFVSQTYTGMRYVPIIGRRGESSAAWDNSEPYEPLTIVTYSNESYTSRQYVPAGVAITNTDYWVKTGAYNAQIVALQDALPSSYFDSALTVKDYVDTLASFLPASDFDNDNTVKAYIDGVADLLPSSAFDSVNTVRGALNGRVRAFETVADMAAATDLVADMICHTNGFYTSGDGGAAFYEIKSTGTANAMDIIACQDSLLAHLVITEPFVSPEQFGAYGDGTHDDTSAINYMFANYSTNYAVKFMPKEYATTDTIEISGKVNIDFNNAQISFTPTLATDVAMHIELNNSSIANLIMYSMVQGNGIGITGHSYYSHFENIFVRYFDIGIKYLETEVLNTNVENTFENIKCGTCKTYGIYYGAASNAKLTDAHWNNIFISSNSSISDNVCAFFIGAGAGHKISNVHIYGDWQDAIDINDYNQTQITGVEIERFAKNALLLPRGRGYIQISNVQARTGQDYADFTTPRCMRVEKSSSGSITGAYAYVTNFNAYASGSNPISFYAGGSTTTKIVNTNLDNTITKSGSGAVYIDGVAL